MNNILKVFNNFFGFDKPKSQEQSQELLHINQEIYKKSAELSERNKTLSILRKIDEIILGTITHLDQTTQKVTDLIVTDVNFQIASIFVMDKKDGVLKRIARSEAGVEKNNHQEKQISIPLTKTENIMVQSILEKRKIVVKNFKNVLIEPAHNNIEINSVFVYPLLVRDEAIGAMYIGLIEDQDSLSNYTIDLLERLVDVIGIALDNALLYNEVQSSNEKLKALDKMKDEFVSLASHELRTPLSAIKSYLWMVLQQKEDTGKLNPKQELFLDRTYSATERLINLVSDMLDVSRIESGRMHLELKSSNIEGIVADILTEVQPTAENQKIEIIVEKNKTPLSQVTVDPDKIKEVFMNLIGNSLKFTPEGGKITISFKDQRDEIITTIADTGKGIKPEDQEKLFKKFSMISSNYPTESSAQKTGTGLGLYISKSIITMHNGTITVASDGENKGAAFSFSLKKAGSANQPEEEKNEPKQIAQKLPNTSLPHQPGPQA